MTAGKAVALYASSLVCYIGLCAGVARLGTVLTEDKTVVEYVDPDAQVIHPRIWAYVDTDGALIFNNVCPGDPKIYAGKLGPGVQMHSEEARDLQLVQAINSHYDEVCEVPR